MPTVPGGNPIALGRVVVAASGTPVPILQNFSGVDTQAEITAQSLSGAFKVRAVTVQADPENTEGGFLYVGKRGMVIATGVGVLAKLAPGQAQSISDPSGLPGNPFNLFDFVLDADDATDAGYVSAVRA